MSRCFPDALTASASFGLLAGALIAGAEPLPEFAPLGAPETIRRVASAPELQAALTRAAPGDRIVLQPGDYSDVEIGRSFPTEKRLVIAAEPPLGRTRLRNLIITGSGVVVSGVTLETGAVTIRGSHVRVTRCLVRNPRIALSITAGTDILIDHSEVVGHSYRAFYLAPPAQDMVVA